MQTGPGYFPDGPSGPAPTGYRDRYTSSGEWNREREYMDYRRDFDRRAPPSSSGNT